MATELGAGAGEHSPNKEGRLLGPNHTGAQALALLEDTFIDRDRLENIARTGELNNYLVTYASNNERDEYWNGQDSQFQGKAHVEKLQIWNSRVDEFLDQLKDKPEEEFLKRSGVALSAKDLYSQYFGHKNSNIDRFVLDITRNNTPSQIEENRPFLEKFARIFGENSSQVVEFLIDGVKNVQTDLDLFIEKASSDIKLEKSMPGYDYLDQLTTDASKWEEKHPSQAVQQPVREPHKPEPSPTEPPRDKASSLLDEAFEALSKNPLQTTLPPTPIFGNEPEEAETQTPDQLTQRKEGQKDISIDSVLIGFEQFYDSLLQEQRDKLDLQFQGLVNKYYPHDQSSSSSTIKFLDNFRSEIDDFLIYKFSENDKTAMKHKIDDLKFYYSLSSTDKSPERLFIEISEIHDYFNFLKKPYIKPITLPQPDQPTEEPSSEPNQQTEPPNFDIPTFLRRRENTPEPQTEPISPQTSELVEPMRISGGNLLDGVNNELRSTYDESKSFMATPKQLADDLISFEFPFGVRIKKGSTASIEDGKLTLDSKIGFPGGVVKVKATLENDDKGGFKLVSKKIDIPFYIGWLSGKVNDYVDDLNGSVAKALGDRLEKGWALDSYSIEGDSVQLNVRKLPQQPS